MRTDKSLFGIRFIIIDTSMLGKGNESKEEINPDH